MEEEYDWDIYEMFREQIEIQVPLISKHLSLLNQKEHVKESLDELFRYFHTYKASSAYLYLDPLTNLCAKAETVLSSLREDPKIVQESISQWLLLVNSQLNLYLEEMYDNETSLSSLPPALLQQVKITSSYTQPKDTLKNLSLLYMDKNIPRAKKVVPFLRKLVKSVKYSSESDSQNTVLDMKPYNIVIMNLDKENIPIISFIKNSYKNVQIIAIFDKLNSIILKQLLEKGVSHTLTNPLKSQLIQRELLSIVKIFHSSSHIIIDHKKINTFIQTLEPLPNTIFQIMQICDDEEIAIKELIKVVKTDPIISANILQVANSPIYGTNQIKTIDQAVTKFGKRAVKALCMGGTYKSLGSIDLSAYAINEDTFSQVSMMRLSLMLKWYSKVSIADLSILSSTSLLGNIGQLLTSKELINLNIDDKFQEISHTFGIKYAEESLLHTSTNQISSQILRYWKLIPDIVDIIEYSDTPKDAPQHIKKQCVANHIVNTMIPLNGKKQLLIPDETLVLMAEFNLNPALLEKALESLK